jgi:SAM-dependent methyltransferase
MTALDPAPTVSRERLYRMMRVYKETGLLRAAVTVGVFDALAAGAGSAESVAAAVAADVRGTRLLLNGLVALDLVQGSDGNYVLDDGARELLVSTSPTYYGGMVDVVASDHEWDALRDLADAVRHGGSVRDVDAETPGYEYWETFAQRVSPVTTPVAALMTEMLAGWTATVADPEILDLACGHGIYGFTLARQLPTATVTGVDWPNVLDITRRHAAEQGLTDRTNFVPGDMFDVAVDGPFDLVLITNVLHHFSEERATALLQRAARDLRPGGRVAIVGFVAGDEPALDPEPHLFSILMLVWTSAGEVHTAAAHTRMCAAAGLEIDDSRKVPNLPFHVIVARSAQ